MHPQTAEGPGSNPGPSFFEPACYFPATEVLPLTVPYDVAALAADARVGPGLAVEHVVTGVALERVGASTASEDVVALAALQGVPTSAALQGVPPFITSQRALVRAADDDVVALGSVDRAAPDSPRMLSLPPPPVMVSLPPLPTISSWPPRPSMMSSPSRPQMMSSPRVPVSTSSPSVPTMTFPPPGRSVLESTLNPLQAPEDTTSPGSRPVYFRM